MQRAQEEIARLQKQKSREATKVADENKRASEDVAAALRSTSASVRDSRLRDAARHEAAALRAQNAVADLDTKLAQVYERLNDAHRRLAAEEEQESLRRARREEQAARERDRRTQAQERAGREHERHLRTIGKTLTRHDRLHTMALSAIERLQQLPAQITVLFLAANPADEEPLRLDEEARAIGEMIRKSKHRDSVRLESRWAVRPMDLFQAINECRPRVIHFSGHGSEDDEIVFQDDHGNSKPVSKEAIVQTMAAASGDIELVFFNACFSSGQAEAVVAHVRAAIGMTIEIGDEAARVFAAQFYSAIGFGLPVGQAFRQARAMLMLEGIPEEDTPVLFVADGVDADALVLVRPDAAGDHEDGGPTETA